MTSLGQRLRIRENKVNAAALKVRFTSYIKFDPLPQLKRAFSACSWSNRIPGERPQAQADIAPSALTDAGTTPKSQLSPARNFNGKAASGLGNDADLLVRECVGRVAHGRVDGLAR